MITHSMRAAASKTPRNMLLPRQNIDFDHARGFCGCAPPGVSYGSSVPSSVLNINLGCPTFQSQFCLPRARMRLLLVAEFISPQKCTLLVL